MMVSWLKVVTSLDHFGWEIMVLLCPVCMVGCAAEDSRL